ncbi:PhnA domain-containing protein [Sneathiella chinensis]|uniref:PhnA protein n=1 Tax=Sneathiella chinensis TaxID=349750 RepID=A0ABQ5TY68_9PROT|nr:alkylphosphonate utilization protein [Sneathiella chinensis]GLQ04792.1 PhnA protein [Sneathiella chinensis]
MTIETLLATRSGSVCELCSGVIDLAVLDVAPMDDGAPDHVAFVCRTCRDQMDGSAEVDGHHWRCLNDSMWSEVPAVKVLAWRMLNRLSGEGWAQDLLDMMYLDDETLDWAKSGAVAGADKDGDGGHKDSNGAVLQAGDTVILIKDLKVKGAGFTAKRGTAVRGISLVPDNPGQIEGRVNGQHIVILTEFVKKN